MVTSMPIAADSSPSIDAHSVTVCTARRDAGCRQRSRAAARHVPVVSASAGPPLRLSQSGRLVADRRASAPTTGQAPTRRRTRPGPPDQRGARRQTVTSTPGRHQALAVSCREHRAAGCLTCASARPPGYTAAFGAIHPSSKGPSPRPAHEEIARPRRRHGATRSPSALARAPPPAVGQVLRRPSTDAQRAVPRPRRCGGPRRRQPP
jgi:hypothetical protein